MGDHLQVRGLLDLDLVGSSQFQLQRLLYHGPGVDADGALAGAGEQCALERTDEEGGDVAIDDREFCNEVLAPVFVEHHILLSGGTDKEVDL